MGASGEITSELSFTSPVGISQVIKGNGHFSEKANNLCKSKEAQSSVGAVGKLQRFLLPDNYITYI